MLPEPSLTPEPPASAPQYEGSWERGGRSLNAAALWGLLAIGVLYFNAQTVLMVIAMVARHLFGGAPVQISGSHWERLASLLEHHAGPIQVALVLSQYFFMLLPSWWLVRRWHTARVREYVRLRASTLPEVTLAVLATLAVLPAGTFVANELARHLGLPDIVERVTAEIFTAHSPGEFVWLVFVVAVTPAVCEEFFFRGFVQRNFERTLHARSVVLVGVIFGLFHMQPLSLATLALLGILFGYFYYRSKSLLPGMAAHFINNLLAILILYRQPEVGGVALATSAPIPLSWVAISMPLAIALLVLYHRVTGRRTHD